MPLGLWKSKWEIHREDMARFWTEMDRGHEEVQAKLRREQEESDRRHAAAMGQIEREREESAGRHAEFQAQMERRDRDFEEEKARRDKERVESEERWAKLQEESDRRWTELQEKSDALREETRREFAETRSFNREMLIRLERSERNVEAALKMMSDEIVGLRREVHDLTDAVSAQTEAILRLVDRFEEFGGRFAA